jgi:hypothetical protein
MPIHWDDLLLLQTLDRLEGEGRAYQINGEDLMLAVAGQQIRPDQDREAFVRLLAVLEQRGLLLFEQMNYRGAYQPQPHDHNFLQSLWHFQLTESGRDRARGRIVQERLPNPDEDDGRAIPGRILERVGETIGGYYTPAQMVRFFADAGLPPTPTVVPTPDSTIALAFQRLAHLEASDSEERRILRRFLAAFLNDELNPSLEADERDGLISDLAKAGWHLRDDTLVVGERIRTPAPTKPGLGGSGAEAEASPVDLSAAIFLVHGHDRSHLHEVARFLDKASGHEVLILHEQANKGQTLIEKFESNAARAAHAVVLLTGDDRGRAADTSEEQPRGRQNVVLELGFFFGKLGRRHVTVLRDAEVEEPSDIRGLVYIPLDSEGKWKIDLARELNDAGIEVDLNKAP